MVVSGGSVRGDSRVLAATVPSSIAEQDLMVEAQGNGVLSRRAKMRPSVGRHCRTHPLAARADNPANMRRLLWTLACTDCLVASWLIAAGQKDSASRLVSRAGELLDTRARSRDDDEPWKPILAMPWIGGE